MPVVTAARLRRFMSDPRWSAEQTETAENLCSEVEASLSAVLFDAPITPVPVTETAPVLNTGIVGLTYPVFSVEQIDGVALDPAAYVVRSHRLRRNMTPAIYGSVADASGGASILTVPSVTASTYGQLVGFAMSAPSPYVGTVTVTYQAGWGPEPALVNAILRKAAAFMQNRHEDVVIAQGLDGAAPPGPAPETWTAEEVKALDRFRRLDIGSTA